MTQSYNLEQMVSIKSAKHMLRWLVSNQANLYRFSILLHMYNLAWLFAANLDSSSDLACQAVGNQCPNIGIMNACMCLRNKYYGATQSRSSVRPYCDKLEIMPMHEKRWCCVILRTPTRGQDRMSSLFYLSYCVLLCLWRKTVPSICHSKIWLHSTPILHSNTPLHNSTP